MPAILRKILSWLSLALFLALFFNLRCWNKEQVFHDNGVFFIDADCYSRMTRVQRVLNAPWHSIRFHEFENAPIGTAPHTTAPMDLVIAGLAKIMGSLDLAGAYISPLLGAALLIFLWWWAGCLGLPYRNALLLLVAVSPILVHGFLLGRPDHQSLILLLLGVAIAAELAIWRGRSAAWSVVSAAAWALALWTSLFEPLIMLAAILLCRIWVLRKEAFKIRNRVAAGVFLGILAFALLFDGWRFHPSGTSGEVFGRWAQTIGELSHLEFHQLFPWTGWLLPIVPVLLIVRYGKEKCRTSLALAALVLLTIGLSMWYARWGYFLALVFAVSLPWALAVVPWRPAVWALLIVSLWPTASEWERQFFPNEKVEDARREARDDATLLRDTALFLRSSEPGIVLAPWWLSPALVYWSGHPCVAGSSHQSLPGTVDSARFYLSTGAEAEALLKERDVKWVVAYEPSRVIDTSKQILGITPPPSPLILRLYTNPRLAPRFLHLAHQNPYFKVYRAGSPPEPAPPSTTP